MARLSSVALGVAERIEARGGPRAGLVVWQSLARRRGNVALQATAHLAALRCAFLARQLGAFDDLVVRWHAVDGPSRDQDIVTTCKLVARGGDATRAEALARAEVERSPTALALYLHARCLDVLRDEAATRAFEVAAERAQREGVRDIEQGARLRRLALLSRSWSTMSEAFEEARRVSLEGATASAFIDVAEILLSSPSRFDRATALGHLDHVMATARDTHAHRALAVVARWVDSLGEPISALETDRLSALLSRDWVTRRLPTLRNVVRTSLALLAAEDDIALAAAMRDAEAVEPELASLYAEARSVSAEDGGEPKDEVLAAIRALGRANDAARRIEKITTRDPRAWTVARVAIESEDTIVREAGTTLLVKLLRSPTRMVPRGGFLPLAETLARAGNRSVADALYRAAVCRKEAGATEALGLARCREGWHLAERGERMEAIRALREAKTLLA